MQRIKFILISWMLNADQRVNLGATLARRVSTKNLSRKDAYQVAKSSIGLGHSDLAFAIWDSAVFGPEDVSGEDQRRIYLLHEK